MIMAPMWQVRASFRSREGGEGGRGEGPQGRVTIKPAEMCMVLAQVWQVRASLGALRDSVCVWGGGGRAVTGRWDPSQVTC
jgi:hypothetical protein